MNQITACTPEEGKSVEYYSGHLSRGLAHEMANPVINIRLAIDMMEEGYIGKDMRVLVEVIKRNCIRIDNLINERDFPGFLHRTV